MLKIAVIVALFGFLIALYAARRYKMWIFSAFLAVLLGMMYGPPRYVLFSDTTRPVQYQGANDWVTYGWQINPLFPNEKYATAIKFRHNSKSYSQLNPNEVRQAAIPFGVPRGALSTYLWWLLVPFWLAFNLSLMGLRRLYRALRGYRQAYSAASIQDTINAYQYFIQQHNRGLLRPWRLLKAAQTRQHAVYQKYADRLTFLQHLNSRRAEQSDPSERREIYRYGALLNSIWEMVAWNQSQQQLGLPLQLQIVSEIRCTIGNGVIDYPSISDYLKASLSRQERSWVEQYAATSGIGSLDSLVKRHDISTQQYAKALMAKDWSELTTCVADFRARLKADPSLQSCENIDNALDIAGHYLRLAVFSALPVDTREQYYRRQHKRIIVRLFSEVLSRFLPDEFSHISGNPNFFISPAGATISKLGSLKVQLVFAGSMYNDGTPRFTNQYELQLDSGAEWIMSGQLLSEQTKLSSDQAPLRDTTMSVTSALKPPIRRANARVTGALKQGPEALKVILQEIDEAAKAFVKDELKEELFGDVINAAEALVSEQLEFFSESILNASASALDGLFGLLDEENT